MATRRIKTKAQAYAPQSKDDCAADIKQLGDVQRELLRVSADMNDAIATVTQRFQPQLDALGERIKTLQAGIQTWCEANRAQLTNDNKVKTANLITGEVQWRQRPPSVRITGEEAVLQTLKLVGLAQYIRAKEEPNKEAMLADLAAAREAAGSDDPVKQSIVKTVQTLRGVSGIKFITGVEDFVIAPFEQEVA